LIISHNNKKIKGHENLVPFLFFSSESNKINNNINKINVKIKLINKINKKINKIHKNA